jgi:hypothetical protein
MARRKAATYTWQTDIHASSGIQVLTIGGPDIQARTVDPAESGPAIDERFSALEHEDIWGRNKIFV